MWHTHNNDNRHTCDGNDKHRVYSSDRGRRKEVHVLAFQQQGQSFVSIETPSKCQTTHSYFQGPSRFYLKTLSQNDRHRETFFAFKVRNHWKMFAVASLWWFQEREITNTRCHGKSESTLENERLFYISNEQFFNTIPVSCFLACFYVYMNNKSSNDKHSTVVVVSVFYQSSSIPFLSFCGHSLS